MHFLWGSSNKCHTHTQYDGFNSVVKSSLKINAIIYLKQRAVNSQTVENCYLIHFSRKCQIPTSSIDLCSNQLSNHWLLGSGQKPGLQQSLKVQVETCVCAASRDCGLGISFVRADNSQGQSGSYKFMLPCSGCQIYIRTSGRLVRPSPNCLSKLTTLLLFT